MIKTEADRRIFFEGIKFAPDHLLEQWTARLRAGEKNPTAEGLSRAIIRDFIVRALLDKPQSKITLRWLADCLDKILDFEDPRTALTLQKRAKHRPGGIGVEKAIDIACWVKLAMERGHDKTKASKLAADVFSCDVRYVWRLRKKGQGWAEAMNPSADWDEYFQHKRRPLPSPPQPARTRTR